MSSEFPFVGVSDAEIQAITENTELPLFKEYAWDFEKNCFLYDSAGRHILLEGAEAVKVWVYKALATERYQYLAYSWQYGIEVKPFILSINNITFEQTGATAQVVVEMTTVYGEVTA